MQPLMEAADTNDIALLTESVKEVGARDAFGMTAMMYAALRATMSVYVSLSHMKAD